MFLWISEVFASYPVAPTTANSWQWKQWRWRCEAWETKPLLLDFWEPLLNMVVLKIYFPMYLEYTVLGVYRYFFYHNPTIERNSWHFGLVRKFFQVPLTWILFSPLDKTSYQSHILVLSTCQITTHLFHRLLLTWWYVYFL